MTLGPAADGSRLHLRTRRTDAAPVVWLSAGFALVFIVVLATSLLAGGGAWPGLPFALVSAALGGAAWARQRAWAAAREGQMEGLASRAAAFANRTESEPVARADTAAPLLDLDALGDAPDGTSTQDSGVPLGAGPVWDALPGPEADPAPSAPPRTRA
jgi:hypothetical protein